MVRKYEYMHSVHPSNFHTLSSEDQDSQIGKWLGFLNSLDTGIRVTLSKQKVELELGGQIHVREVVHIQVAGKEDLGGLLETYGFSQEIDLEDTRLSITGETPDYIETTDGPVQCFLLKSLPKHLYYAWIESLFNYANDSGQQVCKEIITYIDPIERNRSLNIMDKKRSMLVSQKGKHMSDLEMEHLKRIYDKLLENSTSLFNIGIVVVVGGEDYKDLKSNIKVFNRNCKASSTMFTPISTKQGQIYYGDYTKPRVTDLDFTAILYPLVSAELIEVPNGVLLGQNMASGGPVVYDIGKRINGNVAIIGTSGSGKSFTAKLFVKRLLDRYNDPDNPPAVFIMDPMGEYIEHKEYYGLDGMIITGDEEMGLDPFKMMSKKDACSILTSVTKTKENPAIYNQFFENANKVNSLEELYEAVDDDAKQYLKGLVKGPMAIAMKGESNINDNIIVAMNGADQDNMSDVLILILVFSKIWKRLNDLPKERLKIFVADEAWLMAKMPGASEKINSIVRMGRKMNIKFVYISQNIDDISEAKGAQSKLIDNISTKIIMRLEPNVIGDAQKVLNMSDYEKEMMMDFRPGQGLLFTDRQRVLVQFEASREETEVYFYTGSPN